MGADRFLLKSIDWSDFFMAVDEVLQKDAPSFQVPLPEEETEVYKLYNERLIKKLEDKVFELEKEVNWRKNLEKELKKSNEQLNLAIEGSGIGMWDWNVPTGETYYTEGWVENFGYNINEVPPHISAWDNLLHPDDREKTFQALNENLNGSNDFYENEHRVRDKSGNWRWFLARGKVMARDETGNPLRHMGTFVEISDRKQAEKELNESQHRLQSILDNTSAIIYIKDKDGKYLLTNTRYESLFNKQKGDFISKTDYDIFPKEIADTFRVNDLQVFDSGQPLEIEESAFHNEAIYTYLSIKFPIRDDSGAVKWVCGISTDISDRKNVEGELLRKEQEANALLNATEDAVALFDREGMIINLNNTYSRRFQRARDKMIGTCIWDLFPPEVAQNRKLNAEKVFNTGLPLNMIDEREGIWNYTNIYPVSNENGEVTRVAVYARDITDLKKTEAALTRSEEKYRGILENIDDGYYEVDTSGNLIFFNKSLSRILGYPESELLSMNYKTLMDEEYAKKVFFIFHRVFKTGKPARAYGWKIIQKDGSERYIDSSVSVIRDASGELKGFGGISRDVTQKRLAEEKLGKSEQKYRGIFDDSVASIYVFDNNKRFIDSNQAGLELLGYSKKELLSLCISDVDGDPVVTLPAHEQLLGGQKLMNYAHQLRRKDGKIITVLNNSIPISNANGEIVGMQSTLMDITDRKNAEDELKSSKEKLQNLYKHLQTAIEQERTKIAREVHDDLGQVLTAIKLDGHWLKNKIPEDQNELIQKTDMTLKLIDSAIQTVKKISSDLRPGLLDDLGLAAAIEWQAVEYQKRAGIRIKVKLKPENLSVPDDISTAVFRIFQEALTNVVNHAHASSVKVDLTLSGGKVELTVKDNGVGITKAQKVHQKSFGLIGMMERTHALKGDIQFAGTPGRGTIVSVSIPVGNS